jgi:pyruvate kinase
VELTWSGATQAGSVRVIVAAAAGKRAAAKASAVAEKGGPITILCHSRDVNPDAYRRTKIVATLGPSTDKEGVLEEMIKTGLDCARVNCSHSDATQIKAMGKKVRQASLSAKKPVALLFDLQGPKIRLGEAKKRDLKRDETVYLTDETEQGDALSVNVPLLSELIGQNSEVVIGDGAPRMEVTSIENEHLAKAKVISAGEVSSRKGVAVTFAESDGTILTEKDLLDLDVAKEVAPDFIALSFVRSAKDVHLLREEMRKRDINSRVIAKIEKVEAYQNLIEIIDAADGVLVARGDYGVEAGVAEVTLMQKKTIRKAQAAGKLVITATQMLESMIDSPAPTRAEATDVANAVLDGTSAVMLSAETSVGSFPVAAVKTMHELSIAVEHDDRVYKTEPREQAASAAEAVMRAGVILAYEAKVKALAVPTTSGGSVRACCRYRPRHPIIALAHDQMVANQLALEWGVYPVLMDVVEGVEETVKVAIEHCRRVAHLDSGDKIVVSAGPASGKTGETHLVTLREIP